MNRTYIVRHTKLDSSVPFRKLADAVKFAKESAKAFGISRNVIVLEEVVKKPVSFQ